MHYPLTYIFPAGFPLHSNEPDEERNALRRALAVERSRPLTDRLRSPYLLPLHHLGWERDRLPFRRRLP